MLHYRVGDQGDYESADTIEDVIEVFREFGIAGPFHRVGMGVTCPGFEGQNYISLYHGPDVETPERPITDPELAALADLDDVATDESRAYGPQAAPKGWDQ